MKISKEDIVLFFPTWYPVKNQTRSGNAINRLAKVLNEDIGIIVLYVGASDQPKKKYMIDFCIEDGVKTYRFLYRRSNIGSKANYFEKINFLFWHLYLSIKGFNLIKKTYGKPKLIHVHVLTRNAVMAMFFKWCYGVRYCITERWSRYFSADGSFSNIVHRAITKIAVQKSNGITTVSEALKSAMQHHGLYHKLFRVVPNSIDTSIFNGYMRQNNTVPVFIHISCFNDRDKNISGIIRTANVLDTLGYKFKLKLIGNGVDRPMLENLTENLQWKNVDLRFEGEKMSNELPAFYYEAEALIIFSNYETFCNVVAEAHCCGLPVIATRTAALPELVNETNGILVDVKDEDKLKKAIISFCEGKLYFNREEIAKTALLAYSEKSVKKAMQSFYAEL